MTARANGDDETERGSGGGEGDAKDHGAAGGSCSLPPAVATSIGQEPCVAGRGTWRERSDRFAWDRLFDDEAVPRLRPGDLTECPGVVQARPDDWDRKVARESSILLARDARTRDRGRQLLSIRMFHALPDKTRGWLEERDAESELLQPHGSGGECRNAWQEIDMFERNVAPCGLALNYTGVLAEHAFLRGGASSREIMRRVHCGAQNTANQDPMSE